MMTLDLRAPFSYVLRAADDPFPLPEQGEGALCYRLNPTEAVRIDPDPRRLLSSLAFSALASSPGAPDGVTLPAGRYRFVQVRRRIDRDELGALAAEQQQDALWQKFRLQPVLYLRFLNEEEGPVSQVLRPISADA